MLLKNRNHKLLEMKEEAPKLEAQKRRFLNRRERHQVKVELSQFKGRK